MSKKGKYRLIRNARYYLPQELATTIGLTVETVYRHIKNGLPANTDTIPYLIYGRNAKEYFSILYAVSPKKNHKDEVICWGCREVFDVISINTECLFTGRYYNEHKAQVQIKGSCPYCNLRFSRFKSIIAVKGMNKGARIPIENITGGNKND